MLFNVAWYNHHEIFLLSNLKETDHLKITDVDVRILLWRSLRNMMECGLDSLCLSPGKVAGFCDHGNEPVT
jgi:hypothetical protein